MYNARLVPMTTHNAVCGLEPVSPYTSNIVSRKYHAILTTYSGGASPAPTSSCELETMRTYFRDTTLERTQEVQEFLLLLWSEVVVEIASMPEPPPA